MHKNIPLSARHPSGARIRSARLVRQRAKRMRRAGCYRCRVVTGRTDGGGARALTDHGAAEVKLSSILGASCVRSGWRSWRTKGAQKDPCVYLPSIYSEMDG